MKKRKILLIYPKTGKYDAFVKDLPLAVLCAGRSALEAGYDVEILDQRVDQEWEDKLLNTLRHADPLLIGVSVMTGKPIEYALELSRLIKRKSRVPVVWGGIHPTILADSTIENEAVDFLIRGQGELPLLELARVLETSCPDFSTVSALSYKQNGRAVHNPMGEAPDFDALPDIPYDLVDVNKYLRFDPKIKVFSIITSLGCPHQCAFCYSSSYTGRIWKPERFDRTISRMEEIIEKYRPDYFSVIDNDFFVSLKRAKSFFLELEKKKWPIKIGFRGTRIDELYKMDDAFLALMERVGVRHLHIGAESGSQKILDLMIKKVKTHQIFDVNRRLSKFPGLLPTYNFFSGVPTETEEDIKATIKMILKLLKENPYCQITAFNQFTPYPGTELYNLAIKYGFKPPTDLDGWIDFDESDCAKNNPWIDQKRKRLLDILYFTGLFIDQKLNEHFTGNSFRNRFFRHAADLYRPLAKFRFKNSFAAFPLELAIQQLAYKMLESH